MAKRIRTLRRKQVRDAARFSKEAGKPGAEVSRCKTSWKTSKKQLRSKQFRMN